VPRVLTGPCARTAPGLAPGENCVPGCPTGSGKFRSRIGPVCWPPGKRLFSGKTYLCWQPDDRRAAAPMAGTRQALAARVAAAAICRARTQDASHCPRDAPTRCGRARIRPAVAGRARSLPAGMCGSSPAPVRHRHPACRRPSAGSCEREWAATDHRPTNAASPTSASAAKQARATGPRQAWPPGMPRGARSRPRPADSSTQYGPGTSSAGSRYSYRDASARNVHSTRMICARS
jgi:hypothetical protein